MKINWFECDLKCFDSLGMEVSFMELPAPARKQIVNAIAKGNMCGSFQGEVIDEEFVNSLHPVFADQLKYVTDMHKDEVVRREMEAAQRAAIAEYELGHAKEEQNDDE